MPPGIWSQFRPTNTPRRTSTITTIFTNPYKRRIFGLFGELSMTDLRIFTVSPLWTERGSDSLAAFAATSLQSGEVRGLYRTRRRRLRLQTGWEVSGGDNYRGA